MPFKLKLFFIFQICLVSNLFAGRNPSSGYKPVIPKSRFINRSFINTKDFANSTLGPTISAKRANPALYTKMKTLGSGGPPPPPPHDVPFDGGFFLLIGGVALSGFWFYLTQKGKGVNVQKL